MNDNASVTASSLAISEKRPRKTGGCVGIFFQLFDWNRRFAKKKLFSKRLLPPDRAKEASKKFGGDEKLPKLRLIADENSGGFPNMNKNVVSTVGKNVVQTPSLVARLMGLESMPSVQRNKLHKDSSGDFTRREKVMDNTNEFEKETTRQEFRPQKLQKTGMVDRRSVTRFGAEALQLKNVLSRSRKHHHPKLASPVKTTTHHSKRNTSRLIGAATRILEPGLQARNKSKFALTYAHSVRTEPMKFKNLDSSGSSNQPSCKNCGNLLDISESTSKRDAYSSFHQDQEQEFFTSSPSSNHFKDNNQNGVSLSPQLKSNCLPSTTESTDAVSNTKDFVALNKSLTGRTRSRVPTNSLSPGHKRHLPHRKQEESHGVVGSSINKPRMRPEYQGQSSKNSDANNGMAFRFSSPMKNRCEVPTKVEKRSPCKRTLRKKSLSKLSDEKIMLQKPFPLTADSLGAVLQEKLNEITGRMEYESGINGTRTKRKPSHIFQELMCALNMEKPENDMEVSPQRNHLSHHLSCGYDHNTSFCLQKNSRKSGASFGYKNSNHHSPGSVLEASFSNESCCSSSLEDNSSDQFYSGISFNITSSELVETLTEIMWTKFGDFFGTKNSKTQYQLKRFVFDFLMEYLDSKHGQFPKSGFIIDEVVEEVMRWMDMIGLSEDEVAKRDLRDSLGKVTDFEAELSEFGGRIEGELFKMLVDEIVVDLATGICTN